MAFSEPMIGGTQACQQEPAVTTGRARLPFFRQIRYGLAARWALYTAILGTIVTGVLTTYMYQGGVDALIRGELRELAATNQTAALHFEARIASAREAAAVLARSPSINTLMRAHANHGIDPVEGANERQALARVETTFRAILEEQPNTIQLRVVAPDGHEIMRMGRNANGEIQAAPAQALRNLSDKPYFAEALHLSQGKAYISDFDLLQPTGQIELPHRAVVRASAPVYDADGHRLGVLVLNVDLGKLFAIVTETVRQQAVRYIANQDGDYLYQPDPRKTFGFLHGHRYRLQDDLPQLASLFAAYGETSFAGLLDNGQAEYVTDARRIYYNPQQHQRFIVLATLRPKVYVADDIAALRNRTLFMAGVMLVLGTLAVALLAGRLVRPLHVLTEASARIAAGEREIRIASVARRKDEVGDLARSFTSMAAEIAAREDEIRAGAAALARSNKELAQFAYVASHDLQEPLRMVDSYLGLLERRYSDKLDDDAHEFIGYAVAGARRMKSLIDDLLAYSRVSNRPLSLAVVDTGAVVGNVLKMLVQPIAESGAEIAVAALPEVEADCPQLERLFANLIENALKYRGAATPLIRVAAERKDDAWEFSVADNGIGIDAEFRERVFEIFARLNGREKYPGSGIGLASCRRIVERHGGRIWVAETPGGGATFRFTLPVRAAAGEGGDA
jgi:signal transduction histidine kinase